jgi:3-phenylpropionate/trans-cinnamate dioxygenase ferredoxin reductase subunit
MRSTIGQRAIVVVGASLAGVHAVEELRRQRYDGAISLIGAEAELPYDRPPLSKDILTGAKTEADIRLWDGARLGQLSVDTYLGRRAARLELGAREVVLEDGKVIPFTGLIIATGATPRRLPRATALPGVYTLRTLEDATRIRQELLEAPRVVVVGAGFIGLEVASSARSLGLDVTVIEATKSPLEPALGPSIGDALAELHRRHGVVVRCGHSVAAFEGHGRVERVRLVDGRVVAADLVIVGVGVIPATSWLNRSGLILDNGVVCDRTCRAVGTEDVFAAGDVARFRHLLLGELVRLEHWTNAVDQGVAAAGNLLADVADRRPYVDVPYFWSTQHGSMVQFVGSYRPGDDVCIVQGARDGGDWAAIYGRNGRVVGCVGLNRPQTVMRCRKLIESGAEMTETAKLLG